MAISQSKKKKKRQPTITVRVRTYKNEAERREKLRLFAESLKPEYQKGVLV